MIPLRRNRYYLMSADTIDQYQTGTYFIVDNDGRLKTIQMYSHYHGKFFDALDREGIQYKKVGRHWLLTI